MSIREHEDYDKEIERLEETKEYIRRIISLVVEKRLKYRKDMREAFSELDDMDNSLSYASILLNAKLLDSLEQNFGMLKKSKDHPYFARMDIRQSDKDRDEQLYIGKISLFDESMDTPLVVDWRAPIASVYYDGRLGKARYKSYGEEYEIDLFRKRQYTIENGELKHFVDVDISMSDTFLQATLENHASDKLKDIVSTIQSEQNDIIRADIHKPLIVQGVAGSGKTTIALHRIAYLIYTYSDSFQPEDFIIIAPNNLFLDYISSVLPELGAEDVRQTTFPDFMLDVIGERYPLSDQNSKLRLLLKKESLEEYDRGLIIRASAFKNSMLMRKILEAYCGDIEEHFIPPVDFEVNGEVIFTRAYLEEMFRESYAYLPFYKRIDQLESYLDHHVKEAVDEMVAKTRRIYDRRMDRVRKSDMDSEDRKTKLKAAIMDRDEKIKMLQRSRKKAVKDYIKRIDRKDALFFYNRLMTDADLLERYTDDKEVIRFIVEDRIKRIPAKELELEDLAPMAYLHNKLYGIDKSARVKYAVIDEAQDFSDFQFFVLREILNTDRFTILGDLSQGIHMYRAVKDWSYLQESVFEEEVNYLTLLQSYRTTIEIMNEANGVLKKAPIRDLSLANPVVRHGKKPQIRKHKDESSLVKGILETIDKWMQEEYTTIAIITKSEDDAGAIHGALTKGSGYAIGLIEEKAAHFEERIVVLPAYLAKGLEFDAVITTNLHDAFEISALDAKLLYVAMTRAMHRLSLQFISGKNSYF
ncbi:UvrD-helicase domain-containing protein [Proteiniclasticum sp. SCR006]|uniref:DNA 3'-5' helicase n=1 Tax=Proteiniclasticum aestuarii TaxID=2817862 RepID=A0A939H8X3_9CLOT|nr:RNA polymerase recycling motor HelD [Proteiniclasticum aestuarii]MBO1263557.1 UvrD-helicase domain-containing protein [Proteiniclasticum aestuarii]